MSCTSNFRPCIVVEGIGYPLAVPVQPCRAACEIYVTECVEYSALYGISLGTGVYAPPGYDYNLQPLQCNETDIDLWNATLFQNTTYTITTEDGQALTTQCRSIQHTDYSCSPPLERKPGTQRCGFTCPVPSYTDEEYNAAKVMQLTMGWLSWTGSFLVALTYAVDPTLRKFPSNLVLMVTIAAHIAAGAIILPSFGGHQVIWCGVDDQYLLPSLSVVDGNSLDFSVYYSIGDLGAVSSLCTLQGFILQFGYIATTCWWAILSFNMLIALYLREYLPKTSRFVLMQQFSYHMIAWGVSILMAIIPAIAGKVSFQAGATFCFVSPEDDGIWQLLFWLLPMGIMIVLGLIFFCLSLAAILRITFRNDNKKQMFLAYYRLLIFIFLFLVIYICIFSYNIFLAAREEDVEEEYSQYFLCLGKGTKKASSCNLSNEVVQYDLVMLQVWRRCVTNLLSQVGINLPSQSGTTSLSLQRNKGTKASNARITISHGDSIYEDAEVNVGEE
ncbi:hypothetical protein QOT17_009864 [Balamuthia mandrillaris]